MKSWEIHRIGDADIWQFDWSCENFCCEYEQILSEDERKKAQSFYFPKDRERFVQVRHAVRLTLSKYLTTSPANIVLRYGSYGKPEVATEPRLCFNVSHAGTKALVAIAWDCSVGVDIEVERADIDPLLLARSSFSARELKELQAMGESERRLAFFRGWTRKEAYTKGIGLGLHLEFASFDVSLAKENPSLPVAHRYHKDADRWRLYNVEAGEGYVASLAILTV